MTAIMLFPLETSMPAAFTISPPILLCCRYNLSDDMNTRLNLLKTNAATRGWLTVFLTLDIVTQAEDGQPVAPLIAAEAQDGKEPGWPPDSGSKFIVIGDKAYGEL